MSEFKKRILFVGIPDMAFVCLEACYQEHINIVGVMGPKPNHHMYEPFKDFVKNKGLNFIEFTDLKAPDFLQRIKDLNIDMAVVCSFNYKIPEELLNCTKDGFINLHPSLLPEYRGANPYSRVILNNEKITGVTLHHMNSEFDKGDIILQLKCPIEKYETMGSLFNKTNKMCVEMLIATLKEYEERKLPSIPQREGNFITADTIRDRETLINYDNTAEDIERQVRALNPFILATTFFKGTATRVMKVEVLKKHCSDKIPNGTIVEIKNNNIIIKTKKDCIALKVLQFGSIFAGDTTDFIKHIKPQKGERFY